jgi:branched-chain amino acid aminotransferase
LDELLYTSPMPVKAYLLDASNALSLTAYTGPGLDAVSLQLPEGIYTTMRTYEHDRVLGLSAHLKRLVESHARLHRPRPIDLEAIRAALREIIKLENLPALRLRITTPFDSDVVYISVEPFAAYAPETYSQGVRCITSRLQRATPAAKHTSFIAPSRSEKAQIDSDIQEELMVNEQGEILEGFSSNFYGVLEGVLRTANEGILAGITRQVVLAAAEGLVTVSLTPIKLADLSQLSEAFLTSSGREVMPVRQVDAVTVGDPGPITRELMARYRAHVMQDAEKPYR